MKRSRTRDDAGTSVIEVMTVVALLTIVLGVFLQSLVAGQGTAAGVEHRQQNLAEARLLMANSTRDVRTAVRLEAGTSAFLTADATEVKFYGLLRDSDKPQLIRLFVDNKNQLVEQVTPPGGTCPTWTYPGTPGAVRFVGQYIVRDNNDPVFTYFDRDGTELTSTPLSAADLLSIDSVGLNFSVRASTNLKVESTTLRTRVAPPNLDYTKGC
jgi:type II secretory pathway pseudopilin PulG